MKHYYNYTDFYKFIENFIELTIFKDLMLKKEEKDILNIIKKIVFTNNDDIIDLIKEQFHNEENKNKDATFKLKGSQILEEEKLKKFFSTILNKDNKSTFEKNIIDYFDSFSIKKSA